MSRKRRNRRPVAQAEPKKPSSIAEDIRANDGYVNTLAYLGEASALSRANDYQRHSISTDYELLTVLYRENWLAARIIDTPSEDMTRSWYSLASEIDQEKLDELQKLEAKHSIKQEITNAIRWGRLYGGAAAVMVIKGQEDMLDEPLDYDMLQPGCFRGLIVVDKVRGLFPSIELEEDMDDPEFGYPKYYQVILNEEDGQYLTIHHSRLLMFKGRQLPLDEEADNDYWGASEIEHVYEELQKRNSSSANIAQLIFQANVAAIKIADYGEILGMGTAQQRQQVYRTMEEMNRLRTSFGVTLMGNEDSYEQHPYSFAGVAEVYETFMMDMAGAAEIPATKLFGRAPQGMNSTGESDMKNYYEVITQLQERVLRPALEKLLPVMCISLWGKVPEDLEVVFEPLGTTTPSERAEIMSQSSGPIIQAFSAGLISQKTALLELRESGKPINAWTNITDEDIEKAEDEVDQGEEMQDPMGMMGPGGPGGGPGGPGGPEGGPKMPEKPPEGPESGMKPEDVDSQGPQAPEMPESEKPEEEQDALPHDDEALKQSIILALQAGDIAKAQKLIKKYRLADRFRNPDKYKKSEEPEMPVPEAPEAPISAPKPKKDRRVDKMKRGVLKAAQKGDIEGAKNVIKAYRTLEKERPEKRSFLKDALSFVRKMLDGGSGSGNFGHAGRPGKKGGSASKEGAEATAEAEKTKAPNGGSKSGEPVKPVNYASAMKSGKKPEKMMREPVDIGPQESYTPKRRSIVSDKKREVNGPKDSMRWAREYAKKHPEVLEDAKNFRDVLKNVRDFAKTHPGVDDVTVDAVTLEPVPPEEIPGYCVSFHQNYSDKDAYGGYTDEEYALMCAIAKRELGTKSVYIGVYGTPEVSFPCVDLQTASDFARKHNQESIYDPSTGELIFNEEYDKTLNPIIRKKEGAI